MIKKHNTGYKRFASQQQRSEALGVCSAYINSSRFADEVKQAARKATEVQKQEQKRTGKKAQFPVDPTDPCFLDIAPIFCGSDQPLYANNTSAKGHGLICPRDGLKNCSVVDAFDQKQPGDAGKATHFLSWVSPLVLLFVR